MNYINPQTKYTALHNACWRGYKDIVSILLRHGADMTITNSEVGDDDVDVVVAVIVVIVDEG